MNAPKDPAPRRRREVWFPADYEVADIRAVQTLASYARLAETAWDEKTMGAPPPTPTPADVKRALDWIINGAAQTYDNGFTAQDPNGRIAAFVDGRQSVGQQIVKAMKIKVSVIEGKESQT